MKKRSFLYIEFIYFLALCSYITGIFENIKFCSGNSVDS